MKQTSYQISPARSKTDLAEVARLFRAYAQSLSVDLAFQDFETELVTLPGKYGPPHGELFLAQDSKGTVVGVVGIRPIDPAGCCEIKRLYVATDGRGLGIGKGLIDVAVETARRLGYVEIKLDTLLSMAAARKLYLERGFVEVPAYYFNPYQDVVYMSLQL
ncbi:MAG: hypothetical protein M1814_004910 [Vezdaea aestivalis]|nr:MAG: hypothetical protein M1814_004910 [Vezdaea aestivalis]